jgi:hypothetical protein
VKRPSLIALIVALLALAAGGQFIVDYFRGRVARVETKNANAAYPIVLEGIKKHFGLYGRLPDSLQDLKLTNLPADLARFQYTMDGERCRVTFTGEYIWFQHSMDFSLASQSRTNSQVR